MRRSVARLGSHKIQFLGVLLQEAHATDVWPIGLDHAIPASYDIPARLDRLVSLAKLLPSVVAPAAPITWSVDVPNKGFFHVGGSVNDVLGAWPHNYYVFDGDGRLLFRTAHHFSIKGGFFIDVLDLEKFVDALQ